jgi:hypothetical protein
MKLKDTLNIFIDESTKDPSIVIGRLNYWYNHGCQTSALTADEQKFIEVVEDAHRMLTNSKNITSRNTIIGKLKSLHGLNATSQVHFIIQVADALYNSERSWDKRYERQMLIDLCRRKIQECDKEGDHKSLLKYLREYKEILRLDSDNDEEDNTIINKTIELVANPELLAAYNPGDDQRILKAIDKFESKAKAELYGE